jgi:chemotaxis protein methyltransferase CheR
MGEDDVEDLELRLILEGVYQRYGYDFREYARASLKRRVSKCVHEERLSSISALQEKILRDPECMQRLLWTVSVDVTSMFRDPGFYQTFRLVVVPLLRDQPVIRIWHAGCATGQEVYSMAILLKEHGLYDRCRIYATDMNDAALQKAKAGVFPLKAMKEYTANYQQAGGNRAFSEYYTAKYGNALFSPSLQQNVVWAQHNLATDASFNEFHVILCRNVMIYFNHALQARVHDLLYESLSVFGVLALGCKESLQRTPHEADYETIDANHKLYRRIRREDGSPVTEAGRSPVLKPR